jgi:hypothetical protein
MDHKRRRVGRFTIPWATIESRPSEARVALAACLVVRAESLLHEGAVEYLAFSDHFDEVPVDAEAPLYVAEITTINGQPSFVRWRRLSALTTTKEKTMPPPPTIHVCFGQALAALKDGFRAARAGWNGKGMFIFLVPGSTFKVNRPPLLGIYAEGTEIKYHAHIDMKTADGMVVPWLASQTDLLAEDWLLLPAQS